MKNFKTIVASLIIAGISYTTTAQDMETNGTEDDIKTEGVVGISNWSSFNHLAAEMKLLKGANYATTNNVINRLNNTIQTLDNTRPMWMNTEEINEDIADVQKEYQELLADGKFSRKEYRENLEELSEKFEDLREEADEVFMEYVKINRKATEEYREEIKDGEMNDAREEYNEQIKELKGVRDGEKK